ncbi:MAG: acetylxylan esterase [Planctomycetes bacterium]|nr:acetylxylan esterase [Planctomycetota bacterium]
MFPPLPLDFRAASFLDLEIQLQRLAEKRTLACMDRSAAEKTAVSSVSGLKARQAYVRSRVLAAVGDLPSGGGPPPSELRGEITGGDFRIEKIVYASRPGVHVTANLYVPSRLSAPTAAVLFLCGHAEAAKAYAPYQAVCRRLARNRMVVLAADPPGQGERKSYLDTDGSEIVPWGTAEHTYAGLQCWFAGNSPARYFLIDAVSGIDYLASRDEVDPSRIGVTGNSGGGTMTCFLMMLEPRLAAAAPGTYVNSRSSYLLSGRCQDAEQTLPGTVAAGIDHDDFFLAFAPRPALILAATYDFFAIEATRRTWENARRYYRLLGAEDSLGLVEDRVTHAYSPGLAGASVRFFSSCLLGLDASSVDDSDPDVLDPALLSCTRTGQVMLDVPGTARIHDRSLRDAAGRSRTHSHASAVEWLRDRVFRHRDACRLDPRWPWDDVAGDFRVSQGFWFAEESVCNSGFLLRPVSDDWDRLLVAVLDRGNLDLRPSALRFMDAVRSGAAVLAVDLRGMGHIAPRASSQRPVEALHGTMFKLLTDFVYLGDDIASMRVFDLLRTLELARSDPFIALDGRPLGLFGAGLGGFYAFLAGILDDGVPEVEIEDALLDLASVTASRYYRSHRLEQLLIYGMAAEFDFPLLLEAYSGRRLVVTRPRDVNGRVIEWPPPPR